MEQGGAGLQGTSAGFPRKVKMWTEREALRREVGRSQRVPDPVVAASRSAQQVTGAAEESRPQGQEEPGAKSARTGQPPLPRRA